MSSVSPFLKKQPGKDGRCKLYIRISRGNAREYIPTDIKLKYKQGDIKNNQWDDDALCIKNHPHQVMLNNDIKRRILDIETSIITNGSVNAAKSGIAFKEYTERLIKRWSKMKKESTLSQYASEATKMDDFKSGTTLSQITPAFLNEYQTYMFDELENVSNTIGKTMKVIKTVILNAIKEEIITVNPFKIYTAPRYKTGTRIYLTDHELEELEKYLLQNKNKEELVVGWYFLFGCHSGLRFEDMRSFNIKKNVQNGRLQLYTAKTGSPVSIKIGPKLEAIIKQISKLPKLYVNQQANQKIKAVMTNAGITKHISFHCSRHTFAIRCASAGISTEVTGRALGHTDLKTTAIYYRIADKRMDDEMERLG